MENYYKDEFKQFLVDTTNLKKEAVNNIISRINYLAKDANLYPYLNNFTPQNSKRIIDYLEETMDIRPVNNKRNNISDFKNALKEYELFVASDFFKDSVSDNKRTKQIALEREFDKTENNDGLSEEEKLALIKIRLGQSYYRKELIDLWGGCAVTGCENLTVLIASHIKPYRECEGEEKFDKFNGLLLSANYDKLFDSFLISFDENGQILISKSLSDNDLNTLKIKKTDRLINVHPENHKYLEQHRARLVNP